MLPATAKTVGCHTIRRAWSLRRRAALVRCLRLGALFCSTASCASPACESMWARRSFTASAGTGDRQRFLASMGKPPFATASVAARCTLYVTSVTIHRAVCATNACLDHIPPTVTKRCATLSVMTGSHAAVCLCVIFRRGATTREGDEGQ